MDTDKPSLGLVPLGPDQEGSEDGLRAFAAQLAHILNTDPGLPAELRGPPNAPPQTADSILSHADMWARDRKASFFFIVLDGGMVAGSISLSHIDLESRSARIGYFLATRHRGRGVGTEAFTRLLDIARAKGLDRVSGSVPATNAASRKLWEKFGAVFGETGDDVTLFLGADDGAAMVDQPE